MTEMCEIACFGANGMNLCHVFCGSHQGRHRTERLTFEIHVESGYDNTYTLVGQVIAYMNNLFIKKLRLIDTDDVNRIGQQTDICR